MLNIFKYMDYAMKAKQGYNAPDELLAETSFGLIEGFFITSFIVLGLISGGLLYAGFSLGYLLLKIFGFLFLAVLIIDISIYRIVKRAVKNISRKVTKKVEEQINNYRTVDVDATEVE